MRRLYGEAKTIFVFLLLMVGSSLADDFLYVVVVREGSSSAEIHWVPVNDPDAATVIAENLPAMTSIHRHRDELWTWSESKMEKSDLVGQENQPVSNVEVDSNTEIAIQDQFIFTTGSGHITRTNLHTGEQQDLLQMSYDRDLAVYEDRLYFCSEADLRSMRIDGTGLREEPAGLFCNRLGVYGDRLFGYDRVRRNLVEVDLTTGDKVWQSRPLHDTAGDLAATSEAIYWIPEPNVAGTVWRRTHRSDGCNSGSGKIKQPSNPSLLVGRAAT